APALTNQTKVTGTISVTDWLAVTSGPAVGGQTIGNFDIKTDRIIRADGLTWASLGFAAGQQVSFTLAGGTIVGTRTVLGFDNTTPTSGFGSALILGGPALTPMLNVAGTVAVTSRFVVSVPFTVTPSTLTRNDGKTWAADGFKKGQAIAINGQSGYWTVAAEPAGTVLQLQGADLTSLSPAVQKVAIVRI